MHKTVWSGIGSRDKLIFADDGATEADGGASAPLGPTVATPLATSN